MTQHATSIGQRTGLQDGRTPESSPPIQLDIEAVQPIFGGLSKPVDLSRSVLPGNDPEPWHSIDRLAGALYLKRLLVLVRWRAGLLDDSSERMSYQRMINSFLALPHDEILRMCRRPEVTSWVWQLTRDRESGYAPNDDRLLPFLSSFLLPALLAHERFEDGDRIISAATGDGRLDLLRLGRSVRVPAIGGERLVVTRAGHDLVFKGSLGESRIPLQTLLEASGAQTAGVAHLPAVTPGLIVLCRHAWYERYYPEAATQPLALAAGELEEFAATLESALGVMDELWPEAAATVRREIVQLMPLEGRGNTPFNHSVHGFRGLILTSARGSYLGAQTLAHETAHNRFSSIVDLFKVAENADEIFYSPFVEDQRPLINLFHGVFAFTNDVTMARLSLERFRSGGGPNIDRYVADITGRLEQAMDTLERGARVTEKGAELMKAFRDALA